MKQSIYSIGMKRCFDIVFSLIFLLVLSWLYVILALCVRLTSQGSAFVALERVGKNGKHFFLYKFRSMVVNAHTMKEDLLHLNERTDGPLFKIKNDPRVTPFGSFLRKTRLDELPQFWNVFIGDMSIVGPRPHEPNEVAQYSEEQKKVLIITPGITGLAQVTGGADLTFEQENTLDQMYMKNISFFHDISLVFQTISVMFTGKGAS